MRLLLVGDLHYSLRQYDWLVDQASDYDVVVIAGDHLDISSMVPLEAQVPVALAFLSRLAERTRVVASSGNHDLTTRDANGEKAASWILAARNSGVVTDWDSTDVAGVEMTVSPWWDGPLGRAAVDRLLASSRPTEGQPWFWVYHGPPSDSPLAWNGRRSFGDPDLAVWITEHQPSLVMTGHVHQAPFFPDGSWHDRVGATLVLNAGRQPGPIPAHIMIDLEENTADWWSFEGSDQIDLDLHDLDSGREVARTID
jgi:Icc-related predicted phosphoesterase